MAGSSRMMRTRFLLLALCYSLTLSACVSLQEQKDMAVGEYAEHFMKALVHNEKGLEKQTIADIGFLDQHTVNSDEGQARLRKAVQMMGQYLRQTFSETSIDSNKAIFVAKKMEMKEQGGDEEALVVLHAFEPDKSRVVDGTALITRWRKTDEGWKLDMNPYLDNFRNVK
ncbi:MAG: hypothetical protein Q4A74_09895 [Cardiobacteriaceae bacterium]|nr:hypothetical protein [Cardiobacteriaceae bacterium]